MRATPLATDLAPAGLVRPTHRRDGRASRSRSPSGDGALVYLSLGSLGSADVELMQRLVDVLSRAPHRFIVSKGPQHDEFELADNMWGEEFLPAAGDPPAGRRSSSRTAATTRPPSASTSASR